MFRKIAIAVLVCVLGAIIGAGLAMRSAELVAVDDTGYDIAYFDGMTVHGYDFK